MSERGQHTVSTTQYDQKTAASPHSVAGRRKSLDPHPPANPLFSPSLNWCGDSANPCDSRAGAVIRACSSDRKRLLFVSNDRCGDIEDPNG